MTGKRVYLSDEQFKQVQSACMDYTFLGYKPDHSWSDDDQERLRNSILDKFDLDCNDGPLHWHTDQCTCRMCRHHRKVRKSMARERARNTKAAR